MTTNSLLSVAFFAFLMSGQAMASDCAAKIDLKEKGFIPKLLSCVQEIEKENKQPRGDTFPQNAIVASTVECSKLGSNWVTFSEGTGRFLIGAGEEINPAYDGWEMALANGVQPMPLTKYKVLKAGGEEKHLLTIAEMPSHSHSINGHFSLWDDSQSKNSSSGSGRPFKVDTVRTNPEGGDTPHSILPPYVAVYFCKKT